MTPSRADADQGTDGLSQLDSWVRRRPWVVDATFSVATALVLLPTSAALVRGTDWPTPAQVAVLLTILLGHLAVAFRRSRPEAAYGVGCLVMLVLALTPDIAGGGASELAGEAVPPILLPSALVFPVLLYAAAAYTRRPLPLAALAIALVGAMIATARLWALPVDDLPGQPGLDSAGWRLFVLAALVAIVLAAWGLGRYRGVRAAYVEALEERARRAERDRAERAEQAAAAERARISREMHDVVAHSLAVIVRQAEGGRFAASKDPAAAAHVLSVVAETGREALADMRQVLGALHPDRDDAGTPQPTVDDVPAMVERLRTSGVDVQLSSTGSPAPLDRSASLAAYRVVQEALTNVVKHAGPAASASVKIDWHPEELSIAVSDDGSPTDPVRADDHRNGQGLVGMRERVALAGGRMEAGPQQADGRGFRVLASLPVRRP